MYTFFVGWMFMAIFFAIWEDLSYWLFENDENVEYWMSNPDDAY